MMDIKIRVSEFTGMPRLEVNREGISESYSIEFCEVEKLKRHLVMCLCALNSIYPEDEDDKKDC